jgi:Fur family peroxide stress response transcriptional regulator
MDAGLDDRIKKQRLEELQRRCRAQGIPVTLQRRLVLEAVLDLNCHPTANQVYDFLQVRQANVSRATVYRTLEALVELELISKTGHPGGVIRYDGRIELHHHLVCLRCDAVIDITDVRLDELPIPDTSAFGFEVKDCRLQLQGICRSCREREENR